jgi:hypothetical protein
MVRRLIRVDKEFAVKFELFKKKLKKDTGLMKIPDVEATRILAKKMDFEKAHYHNGKKKKKGRLEIDFRF